MKIQHTDASVRLTGRWHTGANSATTTTPGAMLELAFSGKEAVLRFDIETNQHPYPHLWISVDGGCRVETPLSAYIRLEPENDGQHYVQIIYKSAVESQQRWQAPLIGKVTFCGAEVSAPGELPQDNRDCIEFVGDSITEGIAIDVHQQPYENYQWNCVNMNDSTASYAWLTAEKLGLKPVIMGYGCVGVTRSGAGDVPCAAQAYPFCFADAPVEKFCAKYIVINYGANDRTADAAAYETNYTALLDVVRKNNPTAKIIVLGAFCGAHAAILPEMVTNYNKTRNDNIYYIDTTGWVPAEPLHPLREGHQQISKKLFAALKEII